MRFRDRIDAILATYEDDPEAAHLAEDELIREYVLACASRGDLRARALARLIDADVPRWYA